MAIEVAPPAIAGTAWFVMNGDRPDAVACFLALFVWSLVALRKGTLLPLAA